jgi:hypothetical protein
MIARCGVTAETAYLPAVCEQSCSTKSCQHHQGVLREFCTPAASSLCNTLPALSMLMIARSVASQPRQHVDCWSVSGPAHQNCQHRSEPHEFVSCCWIHLLAYTACTGYVDDRTLWRHSEGSMLTAGLWSSPTSANLASIIKGVSHEFCTPAAGFICGTAARLC